MSQLQIEWIFSGYMCQDPEIVNLVFHGVGLEILMGQVVVRAFPPALAVWLVRCLTTKVIGVRTVLKAARTRLAKKSA